jgi:RNA polymerase sigma-70 factor (ECF subfamily)
MVMDLQRERELVERARTDAEAFGELYEEHYGRIFGYVLRRTASIDTAQDVTSDVFFKALSNLHRFRWRGVPFSAWLYRIAGNEIANRHRKDSRDQKHIRDTMVEAGSDNVATGEEANRAEAELIRHEEYMELHASIALLPVKYQEVIGLRFFEDKQIKEISQILDKREGTVKSLLHRGLERLRKSME